MRIFLSIIFIIVCVALTVLVLAQQGKDAGLGSIGGIGDTYWSKNKGNSMEGNLARLTKILGAAFMILALVISFL